jgi:hypothetical protein
VIISRELAAIAQAWRDHRRLVMRLFDPATDPDDIPALRRYLGRTEWFARREVTQRIYEAVRDAELIWPREIARVAMAAKDVPDIDKMVVRDIISRFTKHLPNRMVLNGK